jgi:probable addiction module antidote protein
MKTRPYDSARYLDSDEIIAAYIAEALATGEKSHIAHAIGTVARAKSMTQIAKDAGLSRENLYKALSEDGNPELSTLLRVIKALGLELSAVPARAVKPSASVKARPATRNRRSAKPSVDA